MNTIKSYQEKIEQLLKNKSYGSHPKELYEPISYIISLGGKRMRPVLVLTACDYFDGNIDTAIDAAIAIEMFHNFTLVHDDIMDKAPLRRGKPTVHEKWSDNIAILSGDVMLVKVYQELNKIPADKLPSVLEIFNDTAIKVCEGQQLDMNYEKVQKISIPYYLKMIELKTAVLLGGALKVGAILGGARNEDAQHLYDFGKHLGIAFQLQDDILDVYADADKFGKQKGGDIISNKKTFLLIKAIEMVEGNRYMKEELQQWIHAPNFNATEKVEAVTNIYNFLNVKQLAQNEMQKQYELALSYLDKIPVNNSKKEELIKFAESLMMREV